MSAAMRRLIVNADDFGRSTNVNRGIALAHERGIVTSTSLMVDWPAAQEAAVYAGDHPRLAIGLHLDLDRWSAGGGSRASVEREIERQLAAFQSLMRRAPTHLDSHHHVHRREPARAAAARAGSRLRIPVRECTAGIAYHGEFYGRSESGAPLPDAITLEALIAVIRELPSGTAELGCHPAAGPELDSSYAAERPLELAVLCDPRARAVALEQGIELCSFAEVVA